MRHRLSPFVIINLIWIFCCLLVLFTGNLIPIEIADSAIKSLFYFVIAVSLPVSVIWTCVKIINFKRPGVFIVPAVFLSLFILLLVSCANSMCGTSTETLFINAKDPSNTIIRRNYGCGAYDSDLPVYKTFRVVPINRFLNYVTKIDINEMNSDDWIKVHSSYNKSL